MSKRVYYSVGFIIPSELLFLKVFLDNGVIYGVITILDKE